MQLRPKHKGTKIEWTHRPRPDGTFMPGYTFNPWWGCEKVSPGCKHCYAESWAKRTGHDVWGPHARRFFGDAHWREPLKWDRLAKSLGEQHLVFCQSMGDWAEIAKNLDLLEVMNRERARLFRLVEDTPNLIWLLLTKRPENGMAVVPAAWRNGFPSNAWALTTTENQEELDRRVPHLLAMPAPVHGISAEPLLEDIDASRYLALAPRIACTCARDNHPVGMRCNTQWTRCNAGLRRVDWVICGGESGGKARPFRMQAAESLREQCAKAGAAFFFKQAGDVPVLSSGAGATARERAENEEAQMRAWPEGTRFGNRTRDPKLNGLHVLLQTPKGGNLSELPPALRVRQFPEVRSL